MYFEKPLIQTETPNVFYLAPIPVYQHIYEQDPLNDRVYELGLDTLSDTQKRMGQELPKQYDAERQSTYDVNYNRHDEWVEENEFQPIGSRFWTPPNDFLNRDEFDVKEIRRRITTGLRDLLVGIGKPEAAARQSIITESWMQYYDPYSGRGHNAHNHCRWSSGEAGPLMFSGGYYLSDGQPIADHPYSGVFSFHVRGMKYFIRPKKGMLIIWPYDIIHSVEPFYGAEYRCVINFNIQV